MIKIDEDLISSCRRDDRRAQFRLYEVCYPALISICLRYKRNMDDAKFMLNSGFMKIISNLDRLPEISSFEPWARRIMINTLIDEYRSIKRMNDVIIYDQLEKSNYSLAMSETNLSEYKFDAEELEIMIRKLPEDTCNVFNLYAIDGYTHQEIAEMLEMPVGTSKWHVSRARSMLQAMLHKCVENSKVKAK